jgi:hypothetical protein
VTEVVEVRFIDEEGFGRVIRTTADRAADWREYGEGLTRRRNEIRAAVLHHRPLDEAAQRAQRARRLTLAARQENR